MKKTIRIGAIALIIAMTSFIMMGCKNTEVLATAENPFALASLNVRPDGEKIADRNVDVEGQDAIDLAVELYELACNNDKMTPYRAFYSVCPTHNVAMGMNNDILLNILEFKNNNEYYRIDYRLKQNVELFNTFPYAETPINNSIKLVTAERRYSNTDMDYTRYQQILNANTDANGVPYADWSATDKIIEKIDPNEGESEVKIFSATQEGVYRKSDHVIEADTITTATVTYDATAGIYTIALDLDCTIVDGYNKATEFTRPLIQNGSGADNAKYDSIHIEFTMWDNGYFKEFKSSEYWSAKLQIVLTLDVSSEFLYDEIYSYDEADCNIGKYYANGEFINDYNA